MEADVGELFRLDGKVALVTGASSGLGARFARVLVGAGAHVVLTARREGPLQRLAGELDKATVIVSDLSDPQAAAELVDQAVARCGAIDVVVNNAGRSDQAKALDADLEDYESVLRVNLVAPFAIAAHAARSMSDNGGGAIVNVASILGIVGSGKGRMTAYSASKGGLVNLTRELALQWAGRGVRVNALAPGWFATELTGPLFANERFREWMETRTPLGRPGAEQELDGALLLLASQASSFMTGQVLVVDGGWTAQ